MSKETIGSRIKAFRRSRGLTQEQLAKDLGYSHKSVITHIEKGESEMSYEKMLLLLRTYVADANELFDPKEVEHIDKLIDRERKRPKHDAVVIYIHGLYGNYQEAEFYKFLKDYDVKGLDYEDGNPWEVGPIIKDKFKKMIKPYKEVVVIANSIGAFYTYEYLYEFNIKHVFFISPIANMFQILFGYIMSGKVSEEELEKQKYITLEDGTTLSDDFYKLYAKKPYQGDWKVPTDILYGSRDDLVFIESIVTFLEEHPLSKLTIRKDSEHYIHSEEEKNFIKDWILSSL